MSSYAEWTMPRMNSKGYAPISGGGQTDSPVSSSVHFAKIDQAGHHHGHTMTLSRPPRPPIVPPRLVKKARLTFIQREEALLL